MCMYIYIYVVYVYLVKPIMRRFLHFDMHILSSRLVWLAGKDLDMIELIGTDRVKLSALKPVTLVNIK